MSWARAERTRWSSLHGVESACTPGSLSSTPATPEPADPAPPPKRFYFPGTFSLVPTVYEFEFTDLLRTCAFGVSIGGLTGLTFGFMDAMKSVQETASLKTLSNTAKGQYIFKTCSRTSLLFGGFFTAFHAGKYFTRLTFGSSDELQIAAAGALSLGGLMYKQQNRRLAESAGRVLHELIMHGSGEVRC